LRFCVDYRGLNDLTVKSSYPLPHMEELFDRLQGARYFSKIDLRTGFYQIPLEPADMAKTAFRTRYGHFEWTVLPMGLTNAPATFQHLMHHTFREMLDRCVLVFLDDIVVYSRTLEDHERDVRAVLQRLRERGLYAKQSKCELFQHEIEFLGHRVGRQGLRVMQDKVEAVDRWPQPKNPSELRSFLGLVGYYRRFIEGFSRIAAPLHGLTHTAEGTPPYEWKPEHQRAFDEIKSRLRSAPVLQLPDPDRAYVVNTDASDFAVGAVLQQDQGRGLQPVAFMSHKMTPAETRYPTHDKEMLAVMHALAEWRTYLQGRQPFIIRIRTDHNSLQYFMTQPSLTARQARWLDKLADFDFKIEYVRGPSNTVADALSRRADHVAATALALNTLATDGRCHMNRDEFLSAPYFQPPDASTLLAAARRVADAPEPQWAQSSLALSPITSTASTNSQSPLGFLQSLRAAAERDSAYQALLASSSPPPVSDANQPPAPLARDGLLFRDGRPVIPNDRQLRVQLLAEAHDSASAGHSGVHSTFDRLERRVYWAGMRSDVEAYVASCDSCQRNKVEQHRPAWLLRPPPVPDEPGYALNMDFVTGLPQSRRGFTAFLSITCRLSGLVQVGLCHDTVTAQEAAGLVFDIWVVHYGLPAVIISDRDPRFTGQFWRELWRLLDTQLYMSTAAHPQTDGKAENRQRTLTTMLRHYVDFTQADWDDRLKRAVFAVNHTRSATTRMTPSEIMLARASRLPLDNALEPLRDSDRSRVPAVHSFLERFQLLWHAAREEQLKAQAEQKKYADRHRREDKFAPGDEVLLSTKDLKLPDVADVKRAAKLSARFVGPPA